MEIKYRLSGDIFFLDYMKNGLLLSLKELIKLGIINFKKKRKNKNKRLQKIEAFEKGLNTSVPFNPQTKRYADFVGSTAPPQFAPYTDNLRLRDSNENFNTRLMEYKNEIASQKLLLNDQQARQQALEKDVDVGRKIIMRELMPKPYKPGYMIDDPIDISQTFGSDIFQPQTRQETRDVQPPSISQTPRSVTEEDFFASDFEGLTAKPSQLQQETPRSVTEEDFFASDFEPQVLPPLKQPLMQSDSGEEIQKVGYKFPTVKKSKKPKKSMPLPIYEYSSSSEEDTIPVIPYAPFVKQPKRLIRQKTLYEEDDSEDAPSPKASKQRATPSEGLTASAGGGGEGANAPKRQIPPSLLSPLNISSSKTRPTKVELQQWRKWYLKLGLKDDNVLQANKRSEYKTTITKKLLEDYKSLRGEKDPNVLNSNDPQIIYKAILNKISGI